jgi:hypothetical protein
MVVGFIGDNFMFFILFARMAEGVGEFLLINKSIYLFGPIILGDFKTI